MVLGPSCDILGTVLRNGCIVTLYLNVMTVISWCPADGHDYGNGTKAVLERTRVV